MKIKFNGKSYRVIQPGEEFDGRALLNAKGNQVRGPFVDAVKAETYKALSKKESK